MKKCRLQWECLNRHPEEKRLDAKHLTEIRFQRCRIGEAEGTTY